MVLQSTKELVVVDYNPMTASVLWPQPQPGKGLAEW